MTDSNERSVVRCFVDEAGDPTLFSGKGKVLVAATDAQAIFCSASCMSVTVGTAPGETLLRDADADQIEPISLASMTNEPTSIGVATNKGIWFQALWIALQAAASRVGFSVASDGKGPDEVLHLVLEPNGGDVHIEYQNSRRVIQLKVKSQGTWALKSLLRRYCQIFTERLTSAMTRQPMSLLLRGDKASGARH